MKEENKKPEILFSNKIDTIINKYPKTSKSVLNKIYDFDMTGTQKYFTYLLSVYHLWKRPQMYTYNQILSLVKEYHELIPYMGIGERDIYHKRYEDKMVLKSTVEKYLKIREDRLFEKNKSTHFETILENERYVVMKILSPECAEKYGRGTRWCLTSRTTFKDYYKTYHIFYIVFKENDEKYALVSSLNEKMLDLKNLHNSRDHRINKNELVNVKIIDNLEQRFVDCLDIFNRLEIYCFNQNKKQRHKKSVEEFIRKIENINFNEVDFMLDNELKVKVNESLTDFVERLNIKKKEYFNLDS